MQQEFVLARCFGKVAPVALVCPITFMLDILSGKWTVEILRELFIEPVRTRKFLARIPGLNMKTLRQRLKLLEEHELIKRTVFIDRPLRVEYSLTPKGRELYQVLVSIKLLASRWFNITCNCPFECVAPGGAQQFDCPLRR